MALPADPALRPSVALRTLGFALAWLVLAGPEPGSWLIGLPVIVLATLASLKLAPPLSKGIEPVGLLRFLGFFFIESLRGGWDVAMRTMSPRLRIAPGEMTYTSYLPTGVPVVLFAACVSLLPGTLSQRFDGRQLRLHLLDTGTEQEQALRELERRIAAMLQTEQVPSHG